MFEQLAIFTVSGQVIYQYNALGKKFAESQINSFINQLILNPISKDNKNSLNNNSTANNSSKYGLTLITAEAQLTQKANARNFAVMFDILKQPTIYIVVTYAEQSLQLNKEAIETLDLVTKLWNSLDISTKINSNINSNKIITFGLNDVLNKFNQYFITKYEQSIKYVVTSTTDATTTRINKNKPTSNNISNNNNNNGGGRKWGRNGIIEDISNIDSTALDFSADNDSITKNSLNERTPDSININKDSFGNRTDNGDFLIKEIDDLLDDYDNDSDSELNVQINNSSYLNNAFGLLKRHVLGNKTIDENDLQIVLNKLKDKLVTKNVAPEVATYLTEQVKQDLLGSKTENWTSVEKTAEKSLNKALTQILTPGASVDLLHEIQSKLAKNKIDNKKDPYVFSIVGVNGVGKSTNLSKLAFWLLQNNLKVLIVACDTFRSGAVEQLRVHVENLAQLMNEDHVRGSKNSRGKSGNDFVELFEAGYGGSDLVTKIAKQAIKYASDNEFDIVLMDTAGRRHNDPTLMSPLKSFAEQAKPDKIIMVGEALVGTDSVQQAKNFNDAFGKARNLDFFIISKCDTVGEMLGTMVNMVYATGIPILFVGVGQTYVDLRTLSIQWAVRTLMS